MTSLKKTTATTEDVPAAAELPATVETTAVAVVNESPTDYVPQSDIRFPELKLVHPLSPLSSESGFEDGAIVLNKESVLSDGETPIKITVISKKRFWREKVEYGGGVKPKIVHSEEALRAAGGTVEWINDVPPTYENVLDTIIAIESEKDDPNLPFEFGGKFYGIAKYELKGRAFNKAARLIQTAGEWSLKDGLINGSWTLASKKEKLKKGVAIDPVLKAGPRNSPEVVAFLKSLVSS
jgi:hypothetical protein